MASDPNRRYVLISSDAHAGADLLDYRPYLSSELHDEFDAWASVFHDPWSDFDDDTTNSEDVGLRVGVSSFLSPYNWDSDKRLEHMNGEGIAAEVVFPNTVPPFYPSGVITSPAPSTEEEYRLRWAGVQAHNRWLVDFCSQAPGRRAGLAQVFLADLDDAVAEVRWAREAGLKGVLIPADHASQLVDLYDSSLDPFWAACTELEMPVHRHSQSVSPAETPTTPAAPVIGAHECFLFFRRSLAHLIYGEVFERFPDLKFVLTETGLTWLPMELQQLEVEYRIGLLPGQRGLPALQPRGGQAEHEANRLLPSQLLHRGVRTRPTRRRTPPRGRGRSDHVGLGLPASRRYVPAHAADVAPEPLGRPRARGAGDNVAKRGEGLRARSGPSAKDRRRDRANDRGGRHTRHARRAP